MPSNQWLNLEGREETGQLLVLFGVLFLKALSKRSLLVSNLELAGPVPQEAPSDPHRDAACDVGADGLGGVLHRAHDLLDARQSMHVREVLDDLPGLGLGGRCGKEKVTLFRRRRRRRRIAEEWRRCEVYPEHGAVPLGGGPWLLLESLERVDLLQQRLSFIPSSSLPPSPPHHLSSHPREIGTDKLASTISHLHKPL